MTTDESSPVALRVTVVGDQEPVVVTIAGELDLSTVPVFVAGIDDVLELRPGGVELDLSEVSFIDSSGVGAYVAAFRRARANGTRLSLGSRSPFVERVLQISGVEDALAAESA